MIVAIGLSHATAHAAPAPAPVTAELTPHAAWRAFDADTHTAWCGSVTVQFARPVTIASIAVTADADRDSTDVPPPADPTTRVTIPLGPQQRCLSEVQIQLADQAPIVYGLSPAAVAALPDAIDTLTGALRRCDRRELAHLVSFPLGFREIEHPQRAYATRSGASDPRAFRTVPCGWAVYQDVSESPRIDGSIAPGVVRVAGGAASTTVYWELTWRGNRWLLTSLDTVFFE